MFGLFKKKKRQIKHIRGQMLQELEYWLEHKQSGKPLIVDFMGQKMELLNLSFRKVESDDKKVVMEVTHTLRSYGPHFFRGEIKDPDSECYMDYNTTIFDACGLSGIVPPSATGVDITAWDTPLHEEGE